MKVLKIIAVLIAVIFVFSIIALSRYRLFSPITITEKNAGPYLLVFKKHVGDYKKVGPVMDEIYYDLKNNYSIATTKGFGLYYDNPQEVDKAELRSIVGCIAEGASTEKLKQVSNNYGIKEYPSSKSVVVVFPYKGKMSIIIGVLKVYPKLASYIKEHKYPQTPVMEIYDIPNEKIEYVASFKLSDDVFKSFLK